MEKIITPLSYQAFGNTVPTYLIKSIEIETEYPRVDVQLTCGTKILLAQTYRAVNFKVTLYSIDKIIESYMQQRSLAYAKFNISFSYSGIVHDAKEFTALYSVRNYPSSIITNSFLTAGESRRVTPNVPIPIFYYETDSATADYLIDLGIYYNDAHGTPRYMFSEQQFPQAYLTGGFLRVCDFSDRVPGAITALTFRRGDRGLDLYVDPGLVNGVTFYFRNSFNVWDHITLALSTKKKTAVTSTTALTSTQKIQYDKAVEQTYEVESAALTKSEMAVCEELVAASEIYVLPYGNYDGEIVDLEEIIISDVTCEYSDDNEKLNSIKFSWQYKDRALTFEQRHGLFNARFDNIFD